MRYVALGNSGLRVSRLIFGGHHIGHDLDEKSSHSLVHAAWDHGINAFYTADFYNSGAAQRILGGVLKDRRDEVVIINKIGRGVGTESKHRSIMEGKADEHLLWKEGVAPNSRGLSRKSLIKAFDDSLQRLNTDYVDVCSVHFWDPLTPIDETLEVLALFVEQGKARYIGCSNFAGWQLMRALWVSDVRGYPPMIAFQSEYNMLNRTVEMEQLPACLYGGVGLLAHNSLAGNLLTDKKDLTELGHIAGPRRKHHLDEYVSDGHLERVQSMRDLAQSLGRHPAELAQAWVLSKPGVAALLVGPNEVSDFVPMVRAIDEAVSDADLVAIEEIAVGSPPSTDKTLASRSPN